MHAPAESLSCLIPQQALMSSVGLNDVTLGKGGAVCVSCVCVQNLLAVAKFVSMVTLYDSMFCCVSVEGTCIIVFSHISKSVL